MTTMEEIDTYIKELHLENMVKNYVLHNIPPDYTCLYTIGETALRKRHEIRDNRPVTHKPMDMNVDSFHDPVNANIRPDHELERIRNELVKLELAVQELVTNTRDSDKNDCPVCYMDMSHTSFLTGTCGHRYCGKCCYDNFTRNCHSGLLCPLCRKSMV